MTFHIALGLVAFVIALLGTRLTILGRRRGVAPDIPSLLAGRPAPVANGGIALSFALIICLVIAEIRYGMLLSLLMLTAVALLHGMIGIPRSIRLIVQALAVAVPLSVMSHALFPFLPRGMDLALTGALWIAFIQLFSSLDALEGIAASQAAGIGGGMVLLAVMSGLFPNTLSTYGLIIACGVAGFLWWNRPPARILMGESGTVPLGFLLGYLLLLAAQSGQGHAAAILPAYALAEGGITWLARLKNPRREFYYARAVRRGMKPASVMRYVIGVCLLLVFLAIRTSLEPEIADVYLAVAYLAVFLLMGYFAHEARPERES